MSELTDLAKNIKRPTVSPLVLEQVNQLAKNASNASGILSSGIGAETGFISPAASERRGMALGGEDRTADVLGAIGKRNLRRASDYASGIKRSIDMQAPAINTAGLQRTAGALSQYGNMSAASYAALKQKMLNEQRVKIFEQQQEQSLIGGILGILGQGIGAVVGAL